MTSKKHLVGQEAPPAHLVVRGIDKSFGGLQALKKLILRWLEGEVMALVGDNGAGKSTLMKVLAGAYSADAGSFFLMGRVLASNHLMTPVILVYKLFIKI